MSEDKIIDKIRKLLALAERGGTAEEAESAFAKAQALMAKHAIDEARLVAAGQAPSEEIIKHVVHVRSRDEIKRAKFLLLHHVAKANHCRVVDATDNYDQVWIIGHESDALFVEMLCAAILMQYATERTRGWKAYQAATPESVRMSRFKWLQSFAWGYADRIGQRLVTDTQETAKSTGSELVLASRADAVGTWMDANMNLRKGASRRVSVHRGVMGQGAEAANKADLSGGRNNVQGRNGGELS